MHPEAGSRREAFGCKFGKHRGQGPRNRFPKRRGRHVPQTAYDYCGYQESVAHRRFHLHRCSPHCHTSRSVVGRVMLIPAVLMSRVGGGCGRRAGLGLRRLLCGREERARPAEQRAQRRDGRTPRARVAFVQHEGGEGRRVRSRGGALGLRGCIVWAESQARFPPAAASRLLLSALTAAVERARVHLWRLRAAASAERGAKGVCRLDPPRRWA